MNLYDAAWHISDLLETNRSVFLKLEPEVPDYTVRSPFKIILCGTNRELELDITPENILQVIAQFDATVFDKEKVNRLYTWNFKALAVYFKAITGKFIKPENSIIDLKVIEYFLGTRKKVPENLVECVDRTRLVLNHKGWMPVYKTIHLPLTLRVLPSIESTPLLDEAARKSLYPHYEIEGITSGRMNCLKKFANSYLPHNMGPDVKSVLKPRGYGVRFLSTDYRHCEIAVLQFLSKDERLLEMLSRDEDVYKGIYKAIANDECDTDAKRDKAKKMMISVMYGAGAERLGEIIGVPEPVAKELIRRIRIVFKTACDWMDSQRERAKSGIFTDFFGRPRDFTSEPYKAPDIMVQGLAATVCQEKLIDLFDKLDSNKAYIAYSVHDGYGLVVKLDVARDMYKLVKSTLEAESKLVPGLKMKVEIKFGARLDAMKVLWKD
jgi:hypothetical protein